MPLDHTRVQQALKKVTGTLLAEFDSRGFWVGELSSSALSTAVAVIALHRMGQLELIGPGLRWLAVNVNKDGGWGDTTRSRSNLSTTALVWAAFGATGLEPQFKSVVAGAEAWIIARSGSLEQLPETIVGLYGKDRTFSIPILMTLAVSGRLSGDGWRSVIPLPFELAALPQSWFGVLQLPVVSYALPALIAIGQCIHHHAPSRNPFARWLRNLLKERTLDRLIELQPPNGGFLEATPLTAFVTLGLASMGRVDHPVARRGAAFLTASVRADGSWPIDTNLSTWATTLSIKALAAQPEILGKSERQRVRGWLLAQQYRVRHPYTGAAPGAWAWTDLPGGVPDADDTAGALVALARLGEADAELVNAVEKGVEWLLDLQNRDGGMPTFCRGWGTLPFDQSAPDLTVHAMEAWAGWREKLSTPVARRVDKAMKRALNFLAANQREDGSWVPLWFGNEKTTTQENPVYGTARVLMGLDHVRMAGIPVAEEMRSKAVRFLKGKQNQSGGWGGDAESGESIEETALACEALGDGSGIRRLVELIESREIQAAPIGLYFARLWYYERLYPVIFATSALGRAAAGSVR